MVRVLHGNPTPEETAAVVAVVAASAAAAAAASADNEVGVRMRPDGPLIVSYWNSPSRMMRRRFTLRNRPGPRAWVFSARS
ncbi:acyl-CoA carboxylase subunit epsilon [Micrococcales bacterium 31B]|nr:acyl-CoA carboxylase subunit epsilon [Micrococcales bacterium 31B]